MSLQPKYYCQRCLLSLRVCTRHPAVKVSNLAHNFPQETKNHGWVACSVIFGKITSPVWYLSPPPPRVPREAGWQLGHRERCRAHSGERSVGKLSQHSARTAEAQRWLPLCDRWDKHTTYTKSFTKETRLFQQLWHAACTPWLWNEQALFMVWMLKIPDAGAFSSPNWDTRVWGWKPSPHTAKTHLDLQHFWTDLFKTFIIKKV